MSRITSARVSGGGKRLFSPYLRNGIVVQVAARSEFADMEAFRRAILALPLEFKLDAAPWVRFHSLRGKLLEVTYGQIPRVNGAPGPQHGPVTPNARAGSPRP